MCLTLCAAQAQIVGANTQRESLIKPTKLIPEYRPTGWVLEFTSPCPFGISVGKQITSAIMVGGGVGFNYLEIYGSTWGRSDWSIPIYLQARVGTPKYNFSLFADAKIGFDLKQTDNDAEFLPVGIVQGGFAWRNLYLSAGVNVFYDSEMWSGYYRSGLNTTFVLSLTYRITFETIRKVLL